MTAMSHRAERGFWRLAWGLGMVALLLTAIASGSAQAAERDPMAKRVPDTRLEALRAQQNPMPAEAVSLARGEAVYRGRGSCNVCHGEQGAGDGIGAAGLDPSPRDFTNRAWQKVRTDGELMWVLRHGSPGTAMITVLPGLISEAEGWDVINYIRSLGSAKK